ncbi:Flp pilus assembly complex ATPase component TadA [bacterium]|nr:Flp pilus assembly complex ATPase component TadA [bacterium]
MARLGEMLVNGGYISQEQLDAALKKQKVSNEKLGKILLKMGFIQNENVIKSALMKQLNVGTTQLLEFEITPETVRLIPENLARKYKVIATMLIGKTLFIASATPTDMSMIDNLAFATGFDIQPMLAPENQITHAIERYYNPDSDMLSLFTDQTDEEEIKIVEETTEDITPLQLEDIVQDKPLVKLVDDIIVKALKSGASDIHIEPFEKNVRLRYRIDGNLVERARLPQYLRPAIVSRIKIMGNLDISKTRMPQDGRFKIHYQRRTIDIRLSTVPTVYGEKLTMRLLDPIRLNLDLTQLGFPERDIAVYKQAINLPYGIILVTGPTGSGKTTTLYSSLIELNDKNLNIMTVEDPVEYNIPNINQIQTHDEIGLSFSRVLKAFPRHDPDIILIGEIRDLETAEIAIKAALTGHLVFSTVHTNDAPSTISRLVNLGIPPHFLASSLKLIAAQRLIKTICPRCQVEDHPNPLDLEFLGFTPDEISNTTFLRGEGCPHCNHTGYKGRTGIFEIMPISDNIRDMINSNKNSYEIRKQAINENMVALRQAAINKIKEGLTTVEQVIAQTIG